MSRAHVPRALRQSITDEARARCGYCLTAAWIVGTPMEIDHLVPESLGGQTVRENLWLACSLCNHHKGNRIAATDPESGTVARLFDPRRQRWAEHFAWSAAGTEVAGRTPTGRATVAALRLNRIERIVARRAWVVVGWHPPE